MAPYTGSGNHLPENLRQVSTPRYTAGGKDGDFIVVDEKVLRHERLYALFLFS